MSLSSKVLVREMNALQKNLDTYQQLVADGKDVEFNKEQVKYYRDEVTRIRTAWLSSTATADEEEVEAPAAQPVVAPTAKVSSRQAASSVDSVM